VIDYHLHLWPHSESSVEFRLEQIAEYCEWAGARGVSELALTEHAHRFVEARAATGDFWLARGHEPTSAAMAGYFDWHARNSLDDYVELAVAARESGLPVKVGLEVDYVEGKMTELSALFDQYPFDVLIGSVHWLGTWQFDAYDNPVHGAQWATRDVDAAWSEYAAALGELAASGAVDVLAHPDLIKVAGHVASAPGEVWDAMAASASSAGLAVECSSAGWFKPIGEQYPSAGLLDRYVAAGVGFTTASDAHQLDRVGTRVDELADLLEARGVRELAIFERRRRSYVPLRSR
jgi:histidinol-phosphatase (PHP family)